MKNQTLLIIICIFVGTITSCSKDIDKELTTSRDVSKQLGVQLKAKLIEAIQSGGPEAAISVCNIEAKNISADVSSKNNIEIGRTSLKIRNPANQADAWEIKQLEWFDAQYKLNSDIKNLEVNEIIKIDGKKIFRYMKAIPMQEPCALCHGETLTPLIEEKIKSLYPADQATGFKLGEIRGAFTVKINL